MNKIEVKANALQWILVDRKVLCSRSLFLYIYGTVVKKISSKWKFAAFSAEHDEKRLFSNFILQVMIDRNIFQKLTRDFG